ncbi:MAG TPA: hypothetical protein VFU21_30635 [Kofleriaceae bacterium]|nr:hypothetical protein [Kofleriaceae bacterium]
MRFAIAAVVLSVLAAAGGCRSDNHERPELRAALERATIGLRDSVGVALTESNASVALRARLVMSDDPVFSVGVLEQQNLEDVRIDLATGRVVSTTPAGTASDPCPGSITLAEALTIAEGTAEGDAIAVVPDDDVDCAREIQVLSGVTLIEVKVAGDGRVLEKELSDEYGGGEDDD